MALITVQGTIKDLAGGFYTNGKVYFELDDFFVNTDGVVIPKQTKATDISPTTGQISVTLQSTTDGAPATRGYIVSVTTPYGTFPLGKIQIPNAPATQDLADLLNLAGSYNPVYNLVVPSYAQASLPTVVTGKLVLLTDASKNILVGIGTQWAEVNPVFNVKMFGAKDDGSMDARTAFQAAIDAAYTAGGGIVYAPKGTYLFSSKADGTKVLTAKAGVAIVGAGPGTVFTVPAGFTDWDLFRADADTDDLVFENFVYDGNGTNNLVPPATSRLHNLLDLRYGNRLKVANVTCRNVAGQRCMTIGTSGPSSGYTDVLIEGCHFETVADAVPGNSNQTDHSSIWCNADRARIANNSFTNPTQSTVATAIEVQGQGNVVAHNPINKYNIGSIVAAIYGPATETVCAFNEMTNVRCGYRTYAQDSKDFDLCIYGGSIAQIGEAFPIIDLDHFTTLGRRVVIDGVTIRNLETSPSGSGAFGVAVGKCSNVILQNIVMQNVASRGIAIGTGIGIGNNETRLLIKNVTMIDGGRTSQAGTYATGVCLFSANTLIFLEVSGCHFINSSDATPMLEAIRGNAPVTQSRLSGNTFIGINTPYDYAAAVSAAKLGFYGTAPITQPALDANPTTAQISTVLHDLGLVS